MKKGLLLAFIVFGSLFLSAGLLSKIAVASSRVPTSFIHINHSLAMPASANIALGHLDNDVDLDAFVVMNGPNEVWFNDGTAVFTDSLQRLGSDFSQDVSLGDLNGDLHLDAFIVNRDSFTGAPDRVWLNDGQGNFTSTSQLLGAASSYRVALADVDLDNDLDAFVTGCGNPFSQIANANTLWLNNGTGGFVDSGLDFGQICSVGVAMGDLNDDGFPDVVVGNAGGHPGVEIWLNETAVPATAPTFSQTQQLDLTYNFDIAIADINNDTYPDVVIANSNGLGEPQPNHILTNSGEGHFTDSGHRLGNNTSNGVALADFNLDGYIDIVFGNGSLHQEPQADMVWFNDSSFNFTNEPLKDALTNGVGVGDLDRDGFLDIYVASDNGDQIWRNRLDDHAVFLPLVTQ